MEELIPILTFLYDFYSKVFLYLYFIQNLVVNYWNYTPLIMKKFGKSRFLWRLDRTMARIKKKKKKIIRCTRYMVYVAATRIDKLWKSLA